MLAAQRQKLIVDEIRREGGVRVERADRLLAVSEMTIRRDLDVLAAAGLLEKVHGGATLRGGLSAEEPGFEAKSHRQLNEKEAIARAAARLVEPGQSIGLTRRHDDLAPRPPPRPRSRPDRRRRTRSRSRTSSTATRAPT